MNIGFFTLFFPLPPSLNGRIARTTRFPITKTIFRVRIASWFRRVRFFSSPVPGIHTTNRFSQRPAAPLSCVCLATAAVISCHIIKLTKVIPRNAPVHFSTLGFAVSEKNFIVFLLFFNVTPKNKFTALTIWRSYTHIHVYIYTCIRLRFPMLRWKLLHLGFQCEFRRKNKFYLWGMFHVLSCTHDIMTRNVK